MGSDTTMVYDIFISYRRKDSNGNSNVADARAIKMALEKKGFNVFFDYSECADERFVDTILPAIQTCRYFVLVLTFGALDRCRNEGDWVRREIEEALKYKRKIIPVSPATKPFGEFPKDLPQSIALLPEYQVTTIYMDRMFEKCIDTLIEDRKMEPCHKKGHQDNSINSTSTRELPALKLKSDLDCIFYLDGEEKAQLKAGRMRKFPLRKGEYMLLFVSMDNEQDSKEIIFAMPDEDKIHNVCLSEVRDERLHREGEERRAGEGRIIAENNSRGKEAFAQERSFSINGVSFKMIHVQGGPFQMEIPHYDKKESSFNNYIKNVSLKDYYIGETVVTQELWEALMGTTPSHFKGNNLPVENVSWIDCQEFIKELNLKLKNELSGMNFRLPTDAEWVFAARGGRRTMGYVYSGSSDLEEVAWYGQNSGNSHLSEEEVLSRVGIEQTNKCQTHPVKTKLPNELGIFDMSGNVWEWCEDFGYKHFISPSNIRVQRGGSWDSPATYCRINSCFQDNDYYPGLGYGFRLVLSQKNAANGFVGDSNNVEKRSKAKVKIEMDFFYRSGDFSQGNQYSNWLLVPDISNPSNYSSRNDYHLTNKFSNLGPYGALLAVVDGEPSIVTVKTIREKFVPEILRWVKDDDESIQKFMADVLKTADMNIRDMCVSVVWVWILGIKAYVCWCGNCRAYVLNKKRPYILNKRRLLRLSKDHTYGENLVDRGLITPEQMQYHPEANVLTRNLGNADSLAEPETRVYQLRNDDVFMLCNGSLSSAYQDSEILHEMVAHNHLLESGRYLVRPATFNEKEAVVELCAVNL